jgi:hypothetical protein
MTLRFSGKENSMSDAAMNEKMEFIVDQQAKFAADIEIMRAVQVADAKRLGDGLIGVIDIVGHLARHQMITEDNVNSLTHEVNRLTQAQAQTEERIHVLIDTVERRLSGNGGSTSPT